MKRKLAVVVIFILISFSVFACKTEETKKEDNDRQLSIEEDNTDSEKVIVEDEVTVDFGSSEDKESVNSVNSAKDTIDGTVTDSNKDDANSNFANSEQDENNGSADGGDKELTEHEDSSSETTEPENPYDKDGDGFVDGWY